MATSALDFESNRATGLGWTAGTGRVGAICGPLLGGSLLSAGVAYPWGFYAFAGVGALGAVALLATGRAAVAVEESSQEVAAPTS